jgi:hypothetical protein
MKQAAPSQNTLELLSKLIADREEYFQKALCESAEKTLIYNLKNDLDFLKEKRTQLLEESMNKNQGHLN